MEERDHVAAVPYIAYESAMARNERHIRRLLFALLCVVMLLAATNMAWLYVWSGYDYSAEEESITVDGKNGIANYIGDRGDISNGYDHGEAQKENMD